MVLSSSLLTTQPLKLSLGNPVHFIGIGGIGMSGLAKILLESGIPVSGSDIKENANTQLLAAMGAKIFIGHQASNIPPTGIIIISTAISTENPEIQNAIETHLPIYHRSDLLREIFQGDTLGSEVTIGLTGTHGKTTTTGMVGLALRNGGLDPTIIAGGKIPGLETNAILGKDRKVAVAELDESDGTIVQYTPTHSLISNLELDHADHYTSGLSEIIGTFHRFLSALKSGSQVFLNMACPTTKLIAEALPNGIVPILLAPGEIFAPTEKRITYWLKNARPWKQGCYQGYVYRNNRMLGELNLTVPGKHNLFNALGAIALGDQLDVEFEPMAEALMNFKGMGRRYEKLGQYKGAQLIDDYAHHPTEVSATLKAARESLQNGPGRIIAIFQPHRFTRLQALWEDFKQCFEEADELYITDVYAASEDPIPGVSAEALVKAITDTTGKSDVHYVPKSDWDSLIADLRETAKPMDLILSLGAGDITQLLRNWETSNP